LAAFEAYDPDLRLAEDAMNDHPRHKSGETIRIPEISTQL
jgi:hypothetical protein